MKTPTHDEHGSRCSCRILAETVGCKPEAIALRPDRSIRWRPSWSWTNRS